MKKIAVAICLVAVLSTSLVAKFWFFSSVSNATSDTKADACLADFDIEHGPRLILLPVTMNGRALLFCVDTGAWKTIIDTSLQSELGDSIGTSQVMTSGGGLNLPLFRCPKSSVGALDLTRIGQVACHDLTQMRYASGKEIYGVLGIDFLQNYAVEIDFDGGKCKFWKTAPKSWKNEASSAPLTVDESERPYVTAALPGGKTEPFLIDTGANTSTLREAFFDELTRQGLLTPTGLVSGYAPGGTFQGQVGFVSEIQLNGFSHQSTRLDRDPSSALGLRYLSRYKLKLDLPGRVAYFTPGKRFSLPEPIATSGLSVLQVNGEKVVCAVERGGSGALNHIKPGDIILSVDGHDAKTCDMVSLHEILTSKPGTSVAMRLQRSSQAFDASLELKSRLPIYR